MSGRITTFTIGFMTGVFIDQRYKLPDVTVLVNKAIDRIRDMEKAPQSEEGVKKIENRNWWNRK